MSLCGKYEIPPVSTALKAKRRNNVKDWQEWLSYRLDVSYKDGFKSSHVRGDDRVRTFVSWLFSTVCDYDTVIICGHSLWFRYFFQAYLPRDSKHVAKVNKIQNAGVIGLDFVRYEMDDGNVRYRIEPETITAIYKGFE